MMPERRVAAMSILAGRRARIPILLCCAIAVGAVVVVVTHHVGVGLFVGLATFLAAEHLTKLWGLTPSEQAAEAAAASSRRTNLLRADRDQKWPRY
jgi:cell division protein FtsL